MFIRNPIVLDFVGYFVLSLCTPLEKSCLQKPNLSLKSNCDYIVFFFIQVSCRIKTRYTTGSDWTMYQRSKDFFAGITVIINKSNPNPKP